MSIDEFFDSCIRSSGDLAGVFEFDGSTGYFYLHTTQENESTGVLDSIHVFTGKPDFEDKDISIRWDLEEQRVGLFISGTLWAVFDGRSRTKYGGAYMRGATPLIPADVQSEFDAAFH